MSEPSLVEPVHPALGIAPADPARSPSEVLLSRYRPPQGMVAWTFHRLSGLAIWIFVVVHVIDIYLVGGDPQAYDAILKVYASPAGRVGELLLGAALLYHALNGLRIVIMDFWPRTTVWQTQLWYACWTVFVIVGLPGAYIILKPIWGG